MHKYIKTIKDSIIGFLGFMIFPLMLLSVLAEYLDINYLEALKTAIKAVIAWV